LFRFSFDGFTRRRQLIVVSGEFEILARYLGVFGELRQMSQAPRFNKTLIGVDHFATKAPAGATARLSRTFPDRLTNAWAHLSASPSD
jgi:hypothetical protein